MNILVTGGCGFLGAYVARNLVGQGHEVTVVDLREPTLVSELIAETRSNGELVVKALDVTDGGALQRLCRARRIEGVIHLAGLMTGQCADAPVHGARVNFVGTAIVFETVELLGINKLAWASSVSVYGHQASTAVRADDAPHSVDSFYSLFHSANEQQARIYFETRGVPSTGVRVPFGYGYGRLRGRGSWITDLLTKGAIGVDCTLWGGDVMVPWLYVEDAASALVAAVTTGLNEYHVFNAGNEPRWKHDAADIVMSLVPGVRISIEDGADGYPTGMDDAAIRRYLDWAPGFTLETGLAAAVNRYRKAAGLSEVSLP